MVSTATPWHTLATHAPPPQSWLHAPQLAESLHRFTIEPPHDEPGHARSAEPQPLAHAMSAHAAPHVMSAHAAPHAIVMSAGAHAAPQERSGGGAHIVGWQFPPSPPPPAGELSQAGARSASASARETRVMRAPRRVYQSEAEARRSAAGHRVRIAAARRVRVVVRDGHGRGRG